MIRKKYTKNGGKIADQRETNEVGVNAIALEKVAILSFYFPYRKEWNQDVHVFFAKKWQGTPEESEEMKPKWFKINEIPFDEMWSDDKFWLPKVLNGEKIEAKFIFKSGELIDSYQIKTI